MGLIRTKNNGYAEYSTVIGFIHLADLPTLRTDFTMGSIVRVIEDGSHWVLDDKKVWCLLHEGSGGSGSGGLTYKVVDTLPSPSEAQPNVIYMIKNGDHYDEYILSGTELVKIGDTAPDLDGLVTAADLEEYVKKTELTDGSLSDIVVNNTISAPTFIEDSVRLEDKYLQKADVESGTINFHNINADNIYVTNDIETKNIEAETGTIDELTVKKLKILETLTGTDWSVSESGDIKCDSLTIDNFNGLVIDGKHIIEIIKEYGGGGGGGITPEELESLLPEILGKPQYQADFTEIDSTKPSYIQNKDIVWTTEDFWVGDKATYESVKNTIPAGTHVLLTDGESPDTPDGVQEIVLDYSEIADITDDEKAWVDNTSNDHILELILNNYRNIQDIINLLNDVIILNGG